MIKDTILNVIRSGICGIGYTIVSEEKLLEGVKEKRPVFEIIGTGFLVNTTTAITNRHVIKGLQSIEKRHKGLDRHQRILVFTYPDPNGTLTQGFCYINDFRVVTITNNEYDDIGFIEFNQRPELREKCMPLNFREENDSIQVGTSIGVCGYADGNSLLVDSNDEFYRFGPILQNGFVSAVAPFDSTQGNITQILTDVRTMGGMSGSPVFEIETARVIGIHWGSNTITTGFAVPLSTQKIENLLKGKVGI